MRTPNDRPARRPRNEPRKINGLEIKVAPTNRSTDNVRMIFVSGAVRVGSGSRLGRDYGPKGSLSASCGDHLPKSFSSRSALKSFAQVDRLGQQTLAKYSKNPAAVIFCAGFGHFYPNPLGNQDAQGGLDSTVTSVLVCVCVHADTIFLSAVPAFLPRPYIVFVSEHSLPVGLRDSNYGTSGAP